MNEQKGVSGMWVGGPLLVAALVLLSYWAQPGGPSVRLVDTAGLPLRAATSGEKIVAQLPDEYSHSLLAIERPPAPIEVVWPLKGQGTATGTPSFSAPANDFVLRVYLAHEAVMLDALEKGPVERLRIAVPVRPTPRL